MNKTPSPRGLTVSAWKRACGAVKALLAIAQPSWLLAGAAIFFVTIMLWSVSPAWLQLLLTSLFLFVCGGVVGQCLTSRVGVSDEREFELYRLIVDEVHDAEFLFDCEQLLCWVSPSITRFGGYAPSDLIGRTDILQQLINSLDYDYCRQLIERLTVGGGKHSLELRLTESSGQTRWVLSHWQKLSEQAFLPGGLRVSIEDIQQRKETEYKLLEAVAEAQRLNALRQHYLSRNNEERIRLEALLNSIQLGILFMDRDHRVLHYNRGLKLIWGFGERENLIGLRESVLWASMLSRLENGEKLYTEEGAVFDLSEAGKIFEVQTLNGRTITIYATAVEDDEANDIGKVLIFEDVTALRLNELQLEAQAQRDPLTNLFNRRRFHEDLDRLLADTDRKGNNVGLIMIDLDGFKLVNDQYGHQAGDQVLVTLARELSGTHRRNESLYRLGGDEFCVLVEGASTVSLAKLAQRIVTTVEEQVFEFGGDRVSLSASVGIAIYPQQGGGGDELLAAADKAMYQAKEAGGNRSIGYVESTAEPI